MNDQLQKVLADIITKASVAGTTQNDFVFGAGVSLEW